MPPMAGGKVLDYVHVPIRVQIPLVKVLHKQDVPPEPFTPVFPAVLIPPDARSNKTPGLIVPIPTFPESIIVKAVVPPLLPTLIDIESVVFTADVVDCRINADVAAEPPLIVPIKGVVIVGDVPPTTLPVPVVPENAVAP